MDDTKPCPFCGEPIQKVARKCKWCGEWLDQENHSSSVVYITCPTCGEQIPKGSKVCPLCHESVSGGNPRQTPPPPQQIRHSSKAKVRPLYIVIGCVAVLLLIVGGIKIKSYLNDREYQESIENSPYNVISKNLDEAIAQGKNLSAFLRDEKNVEALKGHFGEDQYSLMLALSAYSDEPLTAKDPKDLNPGGYAWRTPMEKGKYGCRLIVSPSFFGCKYYYDGLEVDEFGQIVRNPAWECDYYKDNFNEDDTSKPYIQYAISMDDNKGVCWIRVDDIWGISFRFSDVSYFSELLLRKDGDVWSLPIDKLSPAEAVLRREGLEQFMQWFISGSSMKLSAVNSDGVAYTAYLAGDETDFYDTFMSHVMKKRINDGIFVKDELSTNK